MRDWKAQPFRNSLSALASRRALEKIVQELEDQLEERRVEALAKGILQGASGMTEEQAHAHLRTLSRRSRKPLKDVALDLIQNRTA
jgi:AmiR/NasT family two-component response regulator